MRLIDADEALRLFGEEYEQTKELIDNGETQLDNLAEGFTEADHIIKYVLPTVDAVVVTRCKDCKYYRNHPNGLCYLHTEPKETERGYSGDAVCVEPDDFCSYGKRKDGGAE